MVTHIRKPPVLPLVDRLGTPSRNRDKGCIHDESGSSGRQPGGALLRALPGRDSGPPRDRMPRSHQAKQLTRFGIGRRKTERRTPESSPTAGGAVARLPPCRLMHRLAPAHASNPRMGNGLWRASYRGRVTQVQGRCSAGHVRSGPSCLPLALVKKGRPMPRESRPRVPGVEAGTLKTRLEAGSWDSVPAVAPRLLTSVRIPPELSRNRQRRLAELHGEP